MKDERVRVFRKALNELIDSLEATSRVNRWVAAEGIPEPLKASAALLVTRLGVADRLASGKFSGTAVDSARVNDICAAMRRLEAAYLSYRQRVERTPADRDAASRVLDEEINDVRNAIAAPN